MKAPDLSRFAPCGMDLTPLRRYWARGSVLTLGWSVFFYLANLNGALQDERFPYSGRTYFAPDFADLLENVFPFLAGIALLSPFFALYFYCYHYAGSKSIYLMRRLPDRWELPRRCLTLPLAMCLWFLILWLVLLLVFLLLYFIFIPHEHIRPDQWAIPWR